MERHQLIVGRTAGLRGGARIGGADCAGLPAHVDHHDLVAEAVHLDERAIGERAHAKPVGFSTSPDEFADTGATG